MLNTRTATGAFLLLPLALAALAGCADRHLPTAVAPEAPRFEQSSAPNAGRLVVWGSDQYGLVSRMPEGDNFTAVSASALWAVAIRADGSLVSWGDDSASFGAVSLTPSTGSYSAVAAGTFHGVAIRSDGTLTSWGSDGYGQISNTPAGNDFVAVAAAEHSSVALRSNGTLVSWGINVHPLIMVTHTPTGNDFTAIASGGFYSVAARSGGGLARWGSFVNPYKTAAFDNTPTTGTYVAVSTKGNHGLALDEAGAITAWGEDDHGQVANTPSGTDFAAISAGHSHSVALRANGTLVSWGDNTDNGVSATPTDDGFLAIAAGYRYTVAIQRAAVTYNFVGFSAPVSNPGVMNVAKAGQTIPLKWRLLHANGTPVTDLGTATVTVTSLACAAGSTTDAVTEYASGSSGLQNLDDGYYQFNWATPKSYANSCKTMNLDLGNGVTRQALFQFTR